LIDAPGTDEAAWRAWPELRRLAVADISGWRRAVIIAAHPDDEVLGVGGIMSMLAAAGARLRLVAVTDGEASHPDGESSHPDGESSHPAVAELAARRVAETAAALQALGADAAEVVRLQLPDTGLACREDELTALLRDLSSGFDICLAPWEHDGHADHEAVGRSARAARSARPARLAGQRLAFYPVWAWHWAFPGDQRVPWRDALRVPLPPAAAAAKCTAIRCFASQLEARPAGRGPVLTAGMLAHFGRAAEVLFPVRQP
jgi:LmbE family N-acetylglucosaminyl deacetylase